MNKIFAESSAGILIELGIGLLPEVIAALKQKNPNLSEILTESNGFADILISIAVEEKKDLES